MKKLSALEIRLLGALEMLLEAAEHQMVDEDGTTLEHDQKIIKYVKATIKSAKGK